ncbi:hypothetical protein [Rhizobium sp. BR 314]|uniref:hypothetical protein n=1 Tax=Rhizobium sp. BR 314 TaxID=3040013 RepID=UPI0039BFDB67
MAMLQLHHAQASSILFEANATPEMLRHETPVNISLNAARAGNNWPASDLGMWPPQSIPPCRGMGAYLTPLRKPDALCRSAVSNGFS